MKLHTKSQQKYKETKILRNLGDGLILRRATVADIDELAAFNGFIDFICLSEPNPEIAQERIRLVYEMIQSLRQHQ